MSIWVTVIARRLLYLLLQEAPQVQYVELNMFLSLHLLYECRVTNPCDAHCIVITILELNRYWNLGCAILSIANSPRTAIGNSYGVIPLEATNLCIMFLQEVSSVHALIHVRFISLGLRRWLKCVVTSIVICIDRFHAIVAVHVISYSNTPLGNF